ncbi:MAG: histidine kinase [Actinomycetota bacterium]
MREKRTPRLGRPLAAWARRPRNSGVKRPGARGPLAVVLVALLAVAVLGTGGPVLLAPLGLAALGAAAFWTWARHRGRGKTLSLDPESEAAPEAVPAGHTGLYFVLLGLVAAAAVAWLLLGLLPAAASVVPPLHRALHRWSSGDGLAAVLAGGAARASHTAEPAPHAFLDYTFSAINLGMAAFLLRLRPRDRTARLFALGMLGASVAFNLQGHEALSLVPPRIYDAVDVVHLLGFHAIAGMSYIFALLLFPDGRLPARRRAGYVVVAVAGGLLVAMLAAGGDHTLGLVVVFGLLTPVAGLGAQVQRYRRARVPEARQQSRILIWALAFALAAGIAGLSATIALSSAGPRGSTRDYEFRAPAPGTYVFICDPHPDTMRGLVEFVGDPGLPRVVEVAAKGERFDRRRLRLPANGEVVVRFTNLDSDAHNVAIYRSLERREGQDILVGTLFSRQGLGPQIFRVFLLVFGVIPVALLVGLLRFRLWDVDRVVKKTLLYGALAGFIGLVYVAVVVGAGSLVGKDLVTSIAATAIVAVAFEPVKEWLQRVANLLVYGHRATPYEVVSRFSDRVAETDALGEVTPRMARIVAEGTGADQARVWLRIGGRLVPVASWPADAPAVPPLALAAAGLPPFEGADRAVPVLHRGEVLGALTVSKTKQALTPAEERLLQGLASQAGIVLRNVALREQLKRKVEEISAQAAELRRSRQRIVAAQDRERRSLERDIHDGAQQHLVALAVKLGLARTLAARDTARARALLVEIGGETEEGLETLRNLARGIYPPVLSEQGIAAALRDHARRVALPVLVEADDLGRLPQGVETAVYFCCLEALQNIAKYASASRIAIRIERVDGELAFTVSDDGIGFDPAAAARGMGLQNMADRVESLGGALEVRSAPGAGTTVSPAGCPCSSGSRWHEEPYDVLAGVGIVRDLVHARRGWPRLHPGEPDRAP